MKGGTKKTPRDLRACSTLFPFLKGLIWTLIYIYFVCRFKGSDDYLRSKFEEYVFAALASVRYRDFVAKGEVNGVLITGGSGSFLTFICNDLEVLICGLVYKAQTQIPQKTSTHYGSPNSKKLTPSKSGTAPQTGCYSTSSNRATHVTKNRPSYQILVFVS